MMYGYEDPVEEQDHVMPWRDIVEALLYAAVAVAILTPVVAVLWLVGEPKTGDEPPTVTGGLAA